MARKIYRIDEFMGLDQSMGSMEGKEVRFGIAQS